jgi:hypothetical protein
MNTKTREHFKTTNERLRQIFTAEAGSDDFENIAKPLIELMRDRVRNGVAKSLAEYSFYAASDLAWDGPPILPENIALMAYAQGKISVSQCEDQLKTLGCAEKFIVEGGPAEEGGKPIKRVDLLKLQEVCVSLARSYVTRRVVAQANKYNQLLPFYKYEARGTSSVAKLRGDAMSQYAEIMADAFGYRHQQTQATRAMLMYAHSLEFPACAWERETQPEIKEDGSIKTRIVREGVPFGLPHPTRTFWDTAHPLATINTDTGCSYVGFWDIAKFGDIYKDERFFNRDKMKWSTSGGNFYRGSRAFFDLYYKDQPINFAYARGNQPAETPGSSMASANDRTDKEGFYTSNDFDQSVFKTDIRMKLVPKEWKLGDYPGPLWLRVILASDDTPVFAEWLPSKPAVYWGHNENDNRVLNQAMMHECMPWQDNLSNVMSQSLIMMKHSLFRIIAVNRDVVPDEIYNEFKKQ